jgi:hypothetical protein
MAVVRPSRRCHAQFLIIGDDNKLYWDDTGKTVFTEPGKDEVVIVDIKDPEAPKIVASLPLMNTVIGPPTNLGITPDESLALVANSLAYQPAGAGWKTVPDNKLFVIDLQSKPPKVIATVEVGKQRRPRPDRQSRRQFDQRTHGQRQGGQARRHGAHGR